MANLTELLNIYRDRRVLLTGHTGFKGAWLGIWLAEVGARVEGVALDPHTEPNLFAEAGLAAALNDRRCDIRDHETLAALVRAARPDVVFHLAAQPLVRRSYAIARETFATNVMGSVHLFDALRSAGHNAVLIHVGTDKCYENLDQGRSFNETDPLGGHDPYSASKAAAEIAFQSYCRSFFQEEGRIAAASGRAGNVIGGGDWAEDRIVPDSVRALRAGRSVAVRNPASARPWQHVLEALSGYLTLGALLLAGDRVARGSWNFGPSPENVRTVKDLVETLLKHWGSGAWHHAGETGAAHEAALLCLDCAKAHRELGWRPRWEFEATASRVTRWYRDFYEGTPARDLCLRDIREYMASDVQGGRP